MGGDDGERIQYRFAERPIERSRFGIADLVAQVDIRDDELHPIALTAELE